MKDSEASKASEASKSSQASYASIASPQILYYLKSASVAAKSGEPRPGGILAEIPPALGEPQNRPEPPRTAQNRPEPLQATEEASHPNQFLVVSKNPFRQA